MKHKTRIDTRTIHTKENIRKNLEEMIIEMDYNKITVSELSRRTGIDRKTFYLHYESISDIFEEFANDISADIIETLDISLSNSTNIDFELLMNSYIGIHAANPKLHKVLFCNESYYMIFDKIQKKLCQHLLTKFLPDNTYDKNSLETTIIFLTYGINAIWRKSYIENGYITEHVSSLSCAFIQSCWNK